MNSQPLTEFLGWSLSRSQRKNDPDSLGVVNSAIARCTDLIHSDVSVMKPELCIAKDFMCSLVDELEANAALLAAVLYRVERAVFLENPEHAVLRRLAHLMRLTSGAEIYYSTEIGHSLNIQHGAGIVVGPRNQIGSGLVIHQGVTIGQRRIGASGESAMIGDGVSLFAGAKVLGNLSIGDGAVVAANAVLICDAEPRSTYAGVPARRVR